MEICKSILKKRLDYYELLLNITPKTHKSYQSIIDKIEDAKMSIHFLDTMDSSVLKYKPRYSISSLLESKITFHGYHYSDVHDQIDDCILLLSNATT